MKVAMVNQSKQGIGGGWSFVHNLSVGLQALGVEVCSWENADIVLIPSSSMIDKELFRKMKAAGKKIVLRIDNVPRNSRNRNTGTSRLKLMSAEADEVVYQSKWAREYLEPFIRRRGVIIHNSIDESVFNPSGAAVGFKGEPVFLYSRYNRDETKNWEQAWYYYQMVQREMPSAKLIIVGRFSPEIVEYGFDFFMGENYEYLGVVDNKYKMAEILRGVDYLIATYFNDCFSNTYLEALKCGVQLREVNRSGGTDEMLKIFYENPHYFDLNRMSADYISLFNKVL